MKVLLVGAGAVGQVYGRHFQGGGADVAFLVRERYAAEARAGYPLYPLDERKRSRGPVWFDGFDVLTDTAEVAQRSWDLVVICVSSTALRRGAWFADLVEAVGDAVVLSLTPGLDDKAFVLESVPPERAVFGLIGLLSYHGPLEGEELPEPGMVYWVPPLTKMTFSGPDGPTQRVVETLDRGGLPSKRVEDATVDGAFAGPVLQMLMVALELCGWRFDALRRDRALMRLAHSAMREAFGAATRRFDRKPPLGLRALRPWMLRLVLRMAPKVVPVDLERFFEAHFTKVADQTEDTLRQTLALARDQGLEYGALAALHERLIEARAS